MNPTIEDRESELIAGAPLGSPGWPCGHPRYPGNTQAIGEAGVRCRICRRRIARKSVRRVRA